MRKTSSESKKAKGTHRKSREKAATIDLKPISSSTTPDELSEEAKIEWDEVYPILTSAQVLSEGDKKLLMMYCEEMAQYWRLKKDLRTQPELLELKNGDGFVVNYRVNPKFDLADKSLKNAQSIGIHFGLTPLSRSKITMTEKPKETPEQKNLNKLNQLRGKVVPITKTA